uniref:RRM domain-containing protein n=1 Tax=Amphimedon queenslandica TaxID=400682 RepID=A0A1X7UJ91_AMPQE
MAAQAKLSSKKRNATNNKNDPRNPRTVFIDNIPLSTKKKDILKLVFPFGSVESLRQRSVVVSPGKLPVGVARKLGKQLTGTTTNFYVVMEMEESASACLELNGQEVDGRHIRVDLATPTNDTHCFVFVGNVPFGVNEEKLRKVFE